MYVWKNSRNSPKLPKRVRVGRLTASNNTTGLVLNRGSIRIGEGVSGIVNAYFNENGNGLTAYARKTQDESFGNEVKLMRKIGRIVPGYVPKIYSANTNTNLRTNFIKGGSLKSWLSRNEKYITDADICLIIIQVLKILQRISIRDPTFRHNDLHIENLLVDDDANKPSINDTGVRVLLTDFGLARDSEFKCEQFEGPNADPDYKAMLREDYGIYVGNDKMYDAAVFLQSIRTNVKSKFIKNIIQSLWKGIKMNAGRPETGERLRYSYRDLIRIFSPAPQNNMVNISTLFTPKNQFQNYIKNKPKDLLMRTNLRAMFPTTTNAQFMKALGFIPRHVRNVSPKLPQQFKSPARLRNAAILGASRFKTANIKKSVKKPTPPRARRPSPARFNFVESPFDPKKFNAANLSRLRPINIENYFTKKGRQSNAKNAIEKIVQTKRTEAWEKAQQMLKGQITVSRR